LWRFVTGAFMSANVLLLTGCQPAFAGSSESANRTTSLADEIHEPDAPNVFM